MIWVLWVPSAQHAAEVEASIDALWPDAALELRVGPAEEHGLAWDGETLRYQQHAEAVSSAEAAILLARSWLHESEAAIGWVPPAPVVEPPAEVVATVEERSGFPARAWVGVGLGERLEIVGLPDAMRLQGGIGLRRWSLGLVASIPVPRTRVPDHIVAAADPREELTYPVAGLGLAVHAAAFPWTGLLQPVGLAGVGIRESARQLYQQNLPRVRPAEGHFQFGPELGLGLQVGAPAVGVRLSAVHRSGVLGAFEHHLVWTTDLLIRM